MYYRTLSTFLRTSCAITRNNLQCHRVQKIHNTVPVMAKMFVDRENSFAHEVLEQSLKPYQIFRLELKTEVLAKDQNLQASLHWILNPTNNLNVTGDDMVKHFRVLVHHLKENSNDCISDARFEAFTQLFVEGSNKLSDDQLLEMLGLLNCLPDVESVKSSNYSELWNALDMECCRRVERWDVDMLLIVSDAFYNLNLARISEFVKDALKKLGRRVRKLRPEQLVQSMFICNLTRRPIYEMFDFEENLTRCVEEMSLRELGVMSMGFFKTQTPIRNPELIEHLYRRLMSEVNTVEDITLVSILKILRYSTKLKQADLTMQLMENLIPHVDRLSLLSCLHIALIGSDMQCCNDELLEIVLKRFNRDIDKTRLKDLERICHVIGVFNMHSPSNIEKELCPKILSSLETRIDEIITHPRCFVKCIHFLSLRGFYDKEMLSAALDKKFIHHAYGRNATLGREIFQLDSFVRINLKDEKYEGNLLADKMRSTMGRVLVHYIPERNSKYKLHLADKVLLEVKDTTDRLIRINALKHVLPHYERPDIVFCYDQKNRKALPLADTCPADYSGTILTREQLIDVPNAADIATVVVVVAGWNNVVREKNRNTGLFDMKLKQLKLLGHKTVLIYWYEWRAAETFVDRVNLLKRKLSTFINL